MACRCQAITISLLPSMHYKVVTQPTTSAAKAAPACIRHLKRCMHASSLPLVHTPGMHPLSLLCLST